MVDPPDVFDRDERLRRDTLHFLEEPRDIAAPHHGEDPAGIMNAADRAMYSAKNLGSNRYTIYEPAVQPAFVESTPG